MIADVMFDEGLSTFGMTISQWNEALESIVHRLFPELIDEHVRMRFTSSFYEARGDKMKYDGHFDPNTQSVFLNHWWMDKEDIPVYQCIAKVLIHELKHFVQYIQGRLTEEMTWSYIENHPEIPWYERPWEVEAIAFEKRHLIEAYFIIRVMGESNV